MTQTVLLRDVVQLNPTTKLPKGSTAKFIPMEKLDAFRRAISDFEVKEFKGGVKFKNGDTLLARITPSLENGKTAYVDILDDDEVAAGSTEFVVMRAIEGVTNSEFVYYISISPEFRDYAIKSMIGTSGRQRVQNDVLARYELELPDLEAQKKIANILGTIDEKIELNRKMNETFEQIGRALFRHYFITNPAVVNWRTSTIGSLCEVVLGGTPSRNNPEYWNGDIGWINSGKVNEFRILKPSETITELGLKKSAAKVLPAGTTVLAITGATLGQVSRLESPFAANQSVIGILGNVNVTNEFMYFWINENIDKIIGHQTGGAQQHINKGNVESFELILPDNDNRDGFQEDILPIMNQIATNTQEIQTLTALRDTLLPRLISGKVKV